MQRLKIRNISETPSYTIFDKFQYSIIYLHKYPFQKDNIKIHYDSYLINQSSLSPPLPKFVMQHISS